MMGNLYVMFFLFIHSENGTTHFYYICEFATSFALGMKIRNSKHLPGGKRVKC